MSTEEGKNGKTLRCNNCGATYEEEYEFCPECGEKLVIDEGSKEGDDPDKIKCTSCGSMISAAFDFCPECGEPIREKENKGEPAETTAQRTGAEAAGNSDVGSGKKISKKAMIVIGGAVAAAIIVIAVLVSITSPRPLILNSGDEIDIYVGDTQTVTAVGDGLDASDYQMTVWSSDNDKVLKVNNGDIEAFYDSSSFNAIDEDEGDEDAADVCSCTTYVNARIEKGMRKWEGSTKVNISIKPVELKNGKLIKKPADSRDSALTVTPLDDYDTYIYLKSKTKESNDMSFTIKRGEETTVNVPRDDYELYWAGGKTWYGSEFLFGPDTEYQKTEDDWDFKDYTWTFKMGVEDGNLGSDTLSEDEFPEL